MLEFDFFFYPAFLPGRFSSPCRHYLLPKPWAKNNVKPWLDPFQMAVSLGVVKMLKFKANVKADWISVEWCFFSCRNF